MKHRLVGAAVLLGIGVILWPVVFDTSVVREISQSSQIPEPPPFERFDVEEPAPVEHQIAADYEQRRSEQVTDTLLNDGDMALSGDDETSAAEPAPRDDSHLLPEPVAQQTLPTTAVAERDENGLPIMWAVQLGVFGQPENAKKLQQRARTAGFKTIMQKTESRNGAVYRVFVDPKLERDAADTLKADVDRALGTNGYVTRYYP